MEIEPGSPTSTRDTEILVKAARIPQGMRRAWVRIPFHSQASIWEVFCPCNTHSTHKEGMLEVVTITLLKTQICLMNGEVVEGPTDYWTAFCQRCNVVYWSTVE